MAFKETVFVVVVDQCSLFSPTVVKRSVSFRIVLSDQIIARVLESTPKAVTPARYCCLATWTRKLRAQSELARLFTGHGKPRKSWNFTFSFSRPTKIWVWGHVPVCWWTLFLIHWRFGHLTNTASNNAREVLKGSSFISPSRRETCCGMFRLPTACLNRWCSQTLFALHVHTFLSSVTPNVNKSWSGSPFAIFLYFTLSVYFVFHSLM